MSCISHYRCLCWLALMVATPSPLLIGEEIGDGEAAASEAAPLSVAPLDHIEYPDDRPAWVVPTLELGPGAHKIVLVSGPSDTEEESAQQLDVMKRAAVSAYLSRRVGSDEIDVEDVFSANEIDEELVVRSYHGEVMQGDMVRYEHAVMMQFGSKQQQRISEAWERRELGHRLGALGLLAFGGLAALIGSSALLGIVVRRSESKHAASAVPPR